MSLSPSYVLFVSNGFLTSEDGCFKGGSICTIIPRFISSIFSVTYIPFPSCRYQLTPRIHLATHDCPHVPRPIKFTVLTRLADRSSAGYQVTRA